MKTKLTFICVFIVGLSLNGFAQLKVDSGGRIGIGGLSPNVLYKLCFGSAILQNSSGSPDLIFGLNPSGTPTRAIYPSTDNSGALGWSGRQFSNIYGKYIYQNGSLVTSDKRLKENFSTIEKPLEKLLKMNGLKYDFKKEATDTIKNEIEKQISLKLENGRLGFVAQDLEKIFPEAVFYDEEIDRYYIEYNAILPIIVEAMKEQQAQIELLKSELATCCQGKLKSGSLSTAINEVNNQNIPTLDQNIPNPFSNETHIGCHIPGASSIANLFIYNLNGVQLQQIVLQGKGKQTVTISGYSFEPGMYLYTLVVDGKEVDTKRMILTK